MSVVEREKREMSIGEKSGMQRALDELSRLANEDRAESIVEILEELWRCPACKTSARHVGVRLGGAAPVDIICESGHEHTVPRAEALEEVVAARGPSYMLPLPEDPTQTRFEKELYLEQLEAVVIVAASLAKQLAHTEDLPNHIQFTATDLAVELKILEGFKKQ